jgi:hypothetical protein
MWRNPRLDNDRMIRRALVLTLIAAAGAHAQTARGTIIGTVVDTSLRPLAGVDVSVAGTNLHVATDSLGRFQIVRLPAGRFTLIARSIGHRPTSSAIDVELGDTLRLALSLEPANAQELAAVVVTERTLSKRLQEFEDRRKNGHGEFFTRADIEKINGTTMADVVRRAKSVRISWDGITALSARETIKSVCPMAIYLDGVPLGSERLDYLPAPNLIAAVEVYPGSASLPAWLPRGPLGTRVGCGAILVWTRDGSDG